MTKLITSVTPLPDGLMKRYHWLDEYLQKLPSTKKELQPAWQAYKYMLRGKMYAYIGIHDNDNRPIATFKLDPGYSSMLRQKYEDIIPGYYMNKTHWSSVYLDGTVPQDVITDIASASYELTLSKLTKKAQQEIKQVIPQVVTPEGSLFNLGVTLRHRLLSCQSTCRLPSGVTTWGITLSLK